MTKESSERFLWECEAGWSNVFEFSRGGNVFELSNGATRNVSVMNFSFNLGSTGKPKNKGSSKLRKAAKRSLQCDASRS